MITEYIVQLGLWNWVALGLILLLLELSAPGIFLMWFGLAALTTAIIAFVLGSLSFMTWQVQIILFLALAVIFVLLGRRYFGIKGSDEEPLLNLRGHQLVGQRATLTEPIENGRGRLRINDTVWRVKGPDMPTGASVRILAFNPVTLELEVEA